MSLSPSISFHFIFLESVSLTECRRLEKKKNKLARKHQDPVSPNPSSRITGLHNCDWLFTCMLWIKFTQQVVY